MPALRLISAPEPALVPGLTSLLIDAVDGGASVGFLAPLSENAAARYWSDAMRRIGDDHALWVMEDSGLVTGSIQLAFCTKENGRHRGEIQKLFVKREYRGRGIAGELLKTAETFARAKGCTLLVLDTLAGSDAERLYRRHGWKRSGEIPFYAAAPDGTLHATVYYFKVIGPIQALGVQSRHVMV